MTLCFDEALDTDVVEKWESIVSRYGGEILPVYLEVSAEVLAGRVTEGSRIGTNKLQCPKELNKVLSENKFGAIPNKNTISIDTNYLCAKQSARLIVEHIRLQAH